jgi:hypothetical protein
MPINSQIFTAPDGLPSILDNSLNGLPQDIRRIIPTPEAVAGEPIQYNDANTVVLLHGEGTNGSTTITDSAAGGSFSWTASGNAQVSTAVAKFGDASLLFDGNGDWVQSTGFNMSSIADSNWTIDFWLYPTAYDDGSSPRTGGIIGGTTGSANTWYIRLTNALGNIGFTGIESGTVWGIGSPSGVFPLNEGTHYAMVRDADLGLYTHYANGINIGTLASTVNIEVASTTTIGKFSNNSAPQTVFYYEGYIDEVRISNIARYASNFTPQTIPYGTAPS